MPKKYLNNPKSVISNSLFMTALKSAMREASLLVKIKSSTYKNNNNNLTVILLYVECGFSITLIKPILNQISIYSVVPCSWSLLQPIKSLLQFANFMLLASNFITWRLLT